MPRDAAPAPINDSIRVVVNVNKLGRRLHSHDDQASGSVYFYFLYAVTCKHLPFVPVAGTTATSSQARWLGFPEPRL